MHSVFRDLVAAAPVEVEELYKEFAADTCPQKIDFIAGAFYNADSKLWISPLAREIDENLVRENITSKYSYQGPVGSESFTRAATSLLLGENRTRVGDGNSAFGVQSLGGSGALLLGLDFLSKVLKRTVVYTSDPGWDNYPIMCACSNFSDTRTYRYWDADNKCLNFEGMCEDLSNAPENAVILLQVCAHNPTGCDPTREQWMQVSKIIKERRLFPFFDCAYLGFASGDMEEDAWVVRYFADQGHELFCALSFSKTLAVYGLRIGCVIIVVNDENKEGVVRSHFLYRARGFYLAPPCQGNLIVEKVLNTPQYLDEWRESIRWRYEQIVYLRKGFRERMEAKTRPGLWKCVTDQAGLFAYIGLSSGVAKILREKHHIYMACMPLTRINIPSLTESNIDRTADAIVEALAELRCEDQ